MLLSIKLVQLDLEWANPEGYLYPTKKMYRVEGVLFPTKQVAVK